MKTYTCSKVCRRNKLGKLTSSHATGELEIHYKLHKPVRSPVGGIMAFSSLSAAEGWRDVGDCVFSAIGREPVPLGEYVLRITRLNVRNARKFWGESKLLRYGGRAALVSLPIDTVAYKELTLVEEIPWQFMTTER